MLRNIIILLAFVFVVFSPCLNADFINLDDEGHVLNNPAVQNLSPDSIKLTFTQTINRIYVPLATLSFAVEKHFFGFDPFVFHLDNLLIYCGVVILVLLLAKHMGLSIGASFFAALIFAIHPMRVETVAWVTERKDVLYAFFYLLALHQYWSYLKTLSMKNYFWTCLFGFISILAKPMALSLPLILLVFDWFYGRSFTKRVFMEKVPILFYIVIVVWISYALNMHHLFGHIISSKAALIWVWSLCFYLWKFCFPFRVSPYYMLPHPISIIHWPYFLSLALFLVLVYLLVRFRGHKLFIFAFLYFFFSVFFLLGLNEDVFNVVSDRFMLLPSLGICFFAGSCVDQRIKTRWGMIVFYALLVLMGIKTNLQCQVWHDSIIFWNEVVREYPDFFIAYNNRGNAESDGLALIDYSKAIALNPKSDKAYNNRGRIYYLKGEDKKAYDDFSKAISINPDFPEACLNRSLLEDADKDYQHALKDALEAKKLGGAVDDAYLNHLQQEIRTGGRGLK